MIEIKRVYETADEKDGTRFFVERLWPRGMKKENLIMDAWVKGVSPSQELRTWYAHDVSKWEEFRIRYKAELEVNLDGWKPLVEAAKKGKITLLYAAHDTEHNGALVLKEFLDEKMRN